MMIRTRLAFVAVFLALTCGVPAAAQDDPTPAQLAQRCDAGDLDGCHKFAFALLTGEGIERDAPRAASLFESNCANGWPRSCRNFGLMSARGDALPQDDVKAFDYYARGCELDDPTSCYLLADSYYNGFGVEPDIVRAAEYARGACDDGEAGACRMVGLLYLDGHMSDGGPDQRFVFYRRGCDLDDGPSCTILGDAHYTGNGLEQDFARALPLYVKACEKGVPEGCHNLGVMYNQGQGVAGDNLRALAYYVRGCEAGNEDSCTVLAGTQESCKSTWTDFVVGGDYAADKPMIVTVIGRIGGDPRALFESGVAGLGVMLIEAQYPYREGDEGSRADRLKEGEGAVLTWPDHDTAYYVESSQRLTDSDSATAYLDRMCSLSDQAVLIGKVNSFTILSEYTAPLE